MPGRGGSTRRPTSLSGQITIDYNPALFTIVPDESGPAGLFTTDPSSAPAVNASEFYDSFSVPALPSPLAGDVWTLNTSTPGVAIITFDLTANPVSLDPSAGDVNMYALTVESTNKLSGFTVNNSPTGDAFEAAGASSSFMRCAAPTGANFPCGQTANTTFPQGLTGIPIPEPGTWAVMVLGFGGLGFAMRRRRKSAAPKASFA